MERLDPTAPADGAAPLALWQRVFWTLAFAGLLSWQAFMVLALFGTHHLGARLLDEEPIVSGAHPLHVYFGFLGSRAFYDHDTLCCYDPAFQAGYPKTPVFDSGSRPSELFLALAGARFSWIPYKLGLACCCCLGPFVLAMAAGCLNLGRVAAWLAAALGMLVWWGAPCRETIENGDLDVLLAGLAAILFSALLVRFDRVPDLRGWLGLLVSGWAGWFTQPFLFAVSVPLVLAYYLSVGARHRLGWHVALAGALAGALGGNAFWLSDWVKSWWIRRPVEFGGDLLSHRTLHTVWAAPLWGGSADRALAAGLLLLAVAGIVLLNEAHRRAAARLFGLGSGGLLVLAILGLTWRPISRLGTSQLVAPAVWFAIVPATHAVVSAAVWVSRVAGGGWRGVVALAALAGALAVGGVETASTLVQQSLRPGLLSIGLGREREQLVDRLRAGELVEGTGRVLLEDRPERMHAPRWTVLLPELTGQSYVGGLDPEGWIEHSFARLVDGVLAGRPIADWSDEQLTQFCRRYHIEAAACWSPAAISRFRAWAGKLDEEPVADDGAGVLFRFRPTTYFLRGKGKVSCLNRTQIVLDDVIPEDSIVVLSQHYQAGMKAWPARVEIERDPDPTGQDPIPFIRLRMAGPSVRVVLSWNDG